MSKKVHVVPHMHWDREWYFTTEESRILLVNNMEEIMERLETDENYPFYILDGQTAVLEDYLDVKPEQRERVKKLVKQGKLIIGPWYTQTDEMVVGGESIVRNLLYGINDCKEFGEPMMIGYLPDSFGQSEKLPQILNGFDITRSIFWRGSSERHGTNKHNFKWKSESEGEVTAHLMPLGYAIGKYLPADVEALKKRMSKYMPVLERGAVTDDILLPNGHDQMPIQKDIYEVMDSLKQIYPEKEFFLSRYENIFDEIEKVDLDTITGELLDGKYMRVHRSIFSTRADLKSSNTRIENKITNILEPLASIACSLGASYEEGLIEDIWKEIMKNHAHDSIGCCCSDKVHKAIENRFFLAEDKTDELIRYYKRKIVDAMDVSKCLDKLTVFNLLPYDRTEVVTGELITKMKNFTLTDESGNVVDYEILETEVVDAGLIDRQIVHYGNYDPFIKYKVAFMDCIPALGYQTYLIEEAEGVAVVANPTHEKIENDFYTITVNTNGTIDVFDKKTGIIYKQVLLIEDGSDDGDEYDFSELEDDFIVTSKDVSAKSMIENYRDLSRITIDFSMIIPKNLDSRKAKICDGSMDVSYIITLEKNSPILKLAVTIDNKACDHRVRMYVPNNIGTKFSLSDNQFGEIKRAVYDSAMDVWEEEKWDERPDSIYPMLSYVALEGKDGLGVLTNSVREFEVIGKDYDMLAITLFRSVGFLGKEELYRRPGRPSGIKMATPDSQLLKKMTFDLAIVRKSECLQKHAKEYISPLVSYNKMPYNAMKLNDANWEAPYSYSLVSVSDSNFIMSAFKKAQGKEGYILRGYQSKEQKMNIEILPKIKMNVEAEVNLAESIVTKFEEEKLVMIPQNVVKSFYLK